MRQDLHPLAARTRPALVARLFSAVRAEQAANDFFDDCLVQFLGLSRSEGRCLDIVDRHGRISAGALAAESGLSTDAVLALIARLQASGYLERLPDGADGQAVVAVTAEARRLVDKVFSHVEAMIAPLLDRLTPEQLRGIVVFLEAAAWINQQRARLLQDHLPAGATTPEERLALAERFSGDAKSLAECIAGRLEAGDDIATVFAQTSD